MLNHCHECVVFKMAPFCVGFNMVMFGRRVSLAASRHRIHIPHTTPHTTPHHTHTPHPHPHTYTHIHRADSRFAPSQWETPLLCNDVSHWLGANLESRFASSQWETASLCNDVSHWLGASLKSALHTYIYGDQLDFRSRQRLQFCSRYF